MAELISEDFEHGRLYGSVRARNPLLNVTDRSLLVTTSKEDLYFVHARYAPNSEFLKWAVASPRRIRVVE